MIHRKASAVWQGDLKSGRGTISSDSGVLDQTPYSFGTRFEQAKGTNPEELIGAAHAGCFSMAFSLNLAQAGHAPDRVATEATVSFDKTDAGFTITAIHLEVQAKVPGIDQATFDQCVTAAKDGCPVSRVLKADISVHAVLEG